MTSRFSPIVLSISFLVLGCSSPLAPHGHRDVWASAAPPLLFNDLGGHHRAITTSSPPAQAYFDQGLRLAWPRADVALTSSRL
jgi:hypothetical protein